MDLSTAILTSLTASSLPLPSQPWLSALLSSRTPPPPLASLVATARARLLSADIAAAGLLDAAYVSAHVFPPPAPAGEPPRRETALAHDVLVQVLDIADLSRSRWEQVEALEAIERGEQTRGRQVVRLPAAGEVGDGSSTQQQQQQQQQQLAAGGGGTHRLVLQDARGRTMFGLELRCGGKVGIGKTVIGEKWLLKSGTVVARGTVLLEPGKYVVLGGKVEAWQKGWVEGRLRRLREEIGADRPQ